MIVPICGDDRTTRHNKRISYARMLVETNVTKKKLPAEIALEGTDENTFKQKVEYGM